MARQKRLQQWSTALVGSVTRAPRERHRSDSSLYYQEVRDLVQTRLADARFDAVENKLDRVLTGIGGESKSQDLLMQLMMERMKELEQKIEKQGSLPPVSPATQAANRNKTSQQAWQDETPIFCRTSNYVVEKATQTPGKEHEAEGVYVLVSKKNDQPVRKVHHQITYAQPEFVEDSPNPKSRNVYVYLEENGTARKIRQPPTPMSAPVLVQKARTRKPLKLAQAYTGYPEYIMNKAPPPVTVRKMRKKVTTAYEGYPEYICQETRVRIPIWDSAKVNKEVMFLPPIPDPYSKRRPRDAGTPSRHMFTGNKNR
ncbi:uncharacterized protein LOC116616313 isoform X2 [Nematostella vectensis]|uniref:uncharacterized protein LOC116616313 isoform X2 n=1 Tax=Nematostella vectensis TaxID=45351 RepID=UPI002077512B|nr:uncharacterized protein LOC116616313 isoform X2 [Nematostella vectensis]XP_048587931.1 uncharacterized protein LOC116616313 isoform X2 [Nematostella vectensis]